MDTSRGVHRGFALWCFVVLSHVHHTHTQYAYGLINSSIDEVCAIQKRIVEFCRSKEDRVAFILGVTNHWVTLVVEKRRKSSLHAFYLDSNNEPVLIATNSQLRTLVETREQKYIKRKGLPYTTWKRNVLYQSFVDQRDIAELLVRCVSQETDIRGEMSKQMWNKLLDSFYEHVNVRDGDHDLFVACLVEWIEQHYPTKAIHDEPIQLLTCYHQLLDKTTLRRLREWVIVCELYSIHTSQVGIDIIEVFYSIIDKIKVIINYQWLDTSQ